MSSRKKNRVAVTICGEEYVLWGDNSIEHLQVVASYVDELMVKLQQKYPRVSKHKIAVLAALNLADELFSAPAGSPTKDQ